MNKKTQNLLKLQIFLFFSKALSRIDTASKKKRNICNFNKFCVFFIHIYIYIYIYIYICIYIYILETKVSCFFRCSLNVNINLQEAKIETK